ncbi:MAG TPA: response regulator [Gemmatimonadaceae bacterium]|nr:response regulator [Gemmatimonadaceae bacterium]
MSPTAIDVRHTPGEGHIGMPKILVIEDDESLRALMSRALRSRGHDVLVARDGAEGLAVWDRERPDLVVTDLYMPNVDGIEAILAFRSRDPGLPIVAVSGGDSRASFLALDSAGDLGATVVLAKPFLPEQLYDAVERALTPRPGA